MTKVADMIIPEIFNPYMIEETTQKSSLIRSGIATSDPDVELTKGGKTINVPFIKDPDHEDEVLDEETGLTSHNITTAESTACVHARGIGYGASDLAKAFSGTDPLGAVTSKLSDLWARRFQKIAISSMKGVFGVAEMKDSVLDKSTEVLTASMMSKAMFLLGDNYDKIKCIAMNSAVLAKLKDLELIEWVQPSTMDPGFPMYMGKRVIVDDGIAPSAEGVHEIYLFGEGAFSYNESPVLANIEYERDAKLGVDNLYSRRYFTMHPRGMQWVGTAAKATPTNEELENPANWKLAADRKNVALALLKAKVESN
jgi:hypothetical protein